MNEQTSSECMPLSLEQVLAASQEALSEIDALGSLDPDVCFVCYHFLCPADEKEDRWGSDAECVELSRPLFKVLPFPVEVDEIGGFVGIEAWERACPTEAWLNDRMPRMVDIAKAAKMKFLGWSFEPRFGRPVSVGLDVAKASTPERKSLIDRVIKSLKAKTN